MILKSARPWLIAALALLGMASIATGAVYFAGWIMLPLLKLPFSAHTPFGFLDYWRNHPQLRETPLGTALMLGLALAGSPLLLLTLKRPRSLHGDARFATPAQVRKAGLFEDRGIIVGRRGGRYLIFGGQQHVLMSAPTRSGKGVGIVIPNLLNWHDSVVVLDIKQENWDLTAGFRAAHGQRCFLFNPAAKDRRTHRYNPLDCISSDAAFRIDDVQKIASMLYPDLPGVDPIWNASCRSLFVGIVLYLKETPSLPCTLGQVLRSTLTAEESSKYFRRLIEERADAGNPLSSECQTALNDFIAVTSDNTRSSIKKTFTSRLELWLNPVIDAATSASDFDVRELRTRRMSLYVGITPDNLERLQPVINLLFQQILDQNTQQLPSQNPALKYGCLLLMDEFTAIGRIGVLSKGISYVAGYNLRMLPIIQSPAQLREVYGKDAADTFAVNHALQIVFAPREFSVCKEISDALGFETVKAASVSKKKNLFARKDPNISTSDQRRALLLPQEVRDIGPDACLLLAEGTPPIRAEKIRYYKDEIFKSRLMPAPAVPVLALGTRLVSVRTPPPPPATTSTTAAPRINPVAPLQTPPLATGAELSTAAAPMLMPAPAVRATDTAQPRTLAYTVFDLLPTTVAMTTQDPIAPSSAIGAEDSTPAEPTDRFGGFSLDFADVDIQPAAISDDELRRLHAAFLESVGIPITA